MMFAMAQEKKDRGNISSTSLPDGELLKQSQILCKKFNFKRALSQENLSSGFPTRLDTIQAVQPQKMATDLKFRISEVGGLYYLCSENKGTDQLCGYINIFVCHFFL